MKKIALTRLGAALLGTAVATLGFAVPASALGISLGGANLIHVDDCRSVALTRQAAYDLAFSSQSTGSRPVRVAAVVDGSLTLCYSLDVSSLSAFSVVTEADVTVNGVVSGLLNQTDASKICSTIRLKAAPGVKGTVSAAAHLHVAVDGAPPVAWDHEFAKDVVMNSLGEDIMLRSCADTSGNVSAS